MQLQDRNRILEASCKQLQAQATNLEPDQHPDQQRNELSLRLIAQNMEDDAKSLDGAPFNATAVGTTLGRLMAALARVEDLCNEWGYTAEAEQVRAALEGTDCWIRRPANGVARADLDPDELARVLNEHQVSDPGERIDQ